jgi:hypothetical protein
MEHIGIVVDDLEAAIVPVALGATLCASPQHC